MGLPLPRLDDRRWSDLVDEGRSLLPLYAPGWTDHNLHDPGITLMELFAWVAELDLYRLDRVPAAHVRKFLALLGIVPRAAAGATVAVGVRLAAGGGSDPLPLPVGVLLDAQTAAGDAAGYMTVEPLTAVLGAITALQAESGGELHDLTPAWRRGEALLPFGADPTVGDAFYLGFSEPPPAGVPISLGFDVEGGGADERARLLARRKEAACQPPQGCCCDDKPCSCDELDAGESGDEDSADVNASEAPLVHHSVRLVWEVAELGGSWQALAAAEVEDDTRALTLSGRVTLQLPAPPAVRRIGEVEADLAYLRCRIARGTYDAPPRLRATILNAVRARQEVPVGPLSFTLVPGAAVEGDEPVAGTVVRIDADFDLQGKITRLATGAENGARLFVLAWEAPTAGDPGRLDVEALLAGRGTGRPNQVLDLPTLLPAGEAMTLLSREGVELRRWRRRNDLDASRRADAHFVVEPRLEDSAEGVPLAQLRVGDGERGRTLAESAPAWAAYRSTRGRLGVLPAGAQLTLADAPRNRALLPDFDDDADRIESVDAPLPSAGGSDGESLDEALLRALEAAESSERAVTLADFERLALATPGVRLARAEARAELHPAFPCYRAPGVVTVLVLPFLPAGLPMPSGGLLASVAAYLNRRRILGTRVEVAGPTYVEVRVRARVQACPGVDRAALLARLRDALDRFFHPLHGGPDGGGWPFGRDVYGSEVYQVLDQTEGSDHVLSLELIGPDGEPRCDNLCLPPDGLPAAGDHELAVEGGGTPC